MQQTNPILVIYATREGQTRRIAEYVAERLRTHDLPVETINARRLPAGFSVAGFSSAVIAASVHAGQYEPEIRRFVKTHPADLNGMLTAFLCVSLSQAGVQDEHATPESRAASARDVKRMTDNFLAGSGWDPPIIQPVAGALMYTKYNFFLRFIMKRIARRAGASTDTSRDHVFTNWQDLDQFAQTFVDRLAAGPARSNGAG